jgi:hypothetical protein
LNNSSEDDCEEWNEEEENGDDSTGMSSFNRISDCDDECTLAEDKDDARWSFVSSN